MREMISMVVVLTVLTAASGLLLGAIEKGTKVKIEEQILKFQQAPAIEEIFADAENDPIKERFKITLDGKELQIFPAKMEDGSFAVAIEQKGKGGYGGDVGFIVGINLKTDEIIGARVTTHSETPGFGARAKDDPDFVSQFPGKPIDQNWNLKANGGEIDGMSGASVTSGALSLAMQQVKDVYLKLKPEIEKQVK